MKRRRLAIALCLLATVSVAVLYVRLKARKEPVWQGKTCSEWFAEFRRAKVRYRQAGIAVVSQIIAPASGRGPPRFVWGTNYFDDTDRLMRDSAADGIRALG